MAASIDFNFIEQTVGSKCASFLRLRLLDKVNVQLPDPEYFELIENEHTLYFLIGLILRICLSTAELSDISAVVDSYNTKETLHNIIRGRGDRRSEAQAVSIVAWLARNILENDSDIPHQVRDLAEVCLPPWSSKEIDARFLQSYCEQRRTGKQHDKALEMAVEPSLYSIFLLGDALVYLQETYSSLFAHGLAHAHQARQYALILNAILQILRSVTAKWSWPIGGNAAADARRIHSLYGGLLQVGNQLHSLFHHQDERKMQFFKNTFESLIRSLDDTISLLRNHGKSGVQCLAESGLSNPMDLGPFLQFLRVTVRELKDITLQENPAGCSGYQEDAFLLRASELEDPIHH